MLGCGIMNAPTTTRVLVCYEVPRIDLWHGLMAEHEFVEAEARNLKSHGRETETFQRSGAAREHLKAIKTAALKGFEKLDAGLLTTGPYFFSIPAVGTMCIGMVGSDASERSFVASPFPLPWLDAVAIQPPINSHLA